jgi:protein-disulfide isomerase
MTLMRLDESKPTLANPVTDRDHAIGPPDAPVTLVEYGDYECPYCGNAFPVVKRLLADLGPKLRFVFRNFPMNSVHPHAGVAAQAAEAAAAQGKFWPMHDLLYEHQADLDTADLEKYALRIGLEIYRFEADLATERFATRVADDVRGGVRSGVNGTPTFFINGRRYDGDKTYDALRAAILAASPAT